MLATTVFLAVLAIAPAHAPHPGGRPLPISAHNCYPSDSTSDARLVEALALGLDNIEIDVGWDDARNVLIVGHDGSPRKGVAYPEFEAYLVPALEAHWKNPRADGAPTVLTIDWKTAHPDAVHRLAAFLDAHPDWFSTAPKASDSPLTVRRLTVCFTGADAAKDRYDSLVPAGGTYRAFRDQVFGAGAFQADVTRYAPTPATAYHRFLTFHWANVERGGPPAAGPWTEDDARRLEALMAAAHRQGFRARFYCLNGHSGEPLGLYRFRSDHEARIRWEAAAKAGVDWVATDEYAEIAAALKPQ